MACRTASGEFAADEVYRDERVVVVVAQQAINPGHLVVVTREHVRNALAMDDALFGHMTRVARDVGARLREALPGSGIMLVFNNEAPCQTVFHAHLHVVPRHDGDEMDRAFGRPVAPPERAAMAARLRPHLEGREGTDHE
jgi:histidine triad (HIT) family protein